MIEMVKQWSDLPLRGLSGPARKVTKLLGRL